MAITKAEGWWINGERLDRWGVTDDDNGVTLTDRQGWDDTPSTRGSNVVLLGKHGESYRAKKYGPGRKTLNLVVTCMDESGSAPATGALRRAAYEANLDKLMRMFAPRHEPLSVERVYANGDRRQADCEVTSVLAPEAIGDTDGRLSIELSVPGAFWEDVDPTTFTLGYNATTGGSQTCEAYSLVGQTGYCGDATVVITGPCTTVSVTDTETGSGFSYGALLVSDTLTIDCEAWTALKGASSVITDLTLVGQEILEISPAPADNRGPSLTVATTGASAGFTVTLTTRRKWLR